SEPNHMADMIAGGIQHKGFALIDCFSPCVTYNKLNTYAYFKKRVYKLDGSYDPSNPKVAMDKAHEWGDKIPIGVVYQDQQPTYEESDPVLKTGSLAKKGLEIDPAVYKTLVDELL